MLASFQPSFGAKDPSGTALYTSSGSGTKTYVAGIGVQLVDLDLWGPGGGGSGTIVVGKAGNFPGYGAAGGGHAQKAKRHVVQGQTLSASVGAKGTGGAAFGDGTDGGQSTLSFGAVSLTANGGAKGTQAGNGTGGTASGGDTNTSGRNGGLTNYWDGGGSGDGGSDQTTTASAGTAPGGGGAGAAGDPGPYSGGDGNDGRFKVTLRN